MANESPAAVFSWTDESKTNLVLTNGQRISQGILQTAINAIFCEAKRLAKELVFRVPLPILDIRVDRSDLVSKIMLSALSPFKYLFATRAITSSKRDEANHYISNANKLMDHILVLVHLVSGLPSRVPELLLMSLAGPTANATLTHGIASGLLNFSIAV